MIDWKQHNFCDNDVEMRVSYGVIDELSVQCQRVDDYYTRICQDEKLRSYTGLTFPYFTIQW